MAAAPDCASVAAADRWVGHIDKALMALRQRVPSAFPDEIYTAPRSWAEKAYPKLIYYNKPPKGGHFAAWEQPQFYSEDVRTGLSPLRKSI
jgi:hypothetical protein